MKIRTKDGERTVVIEHAERKALSSALAVLRDLTLLDRTVEIVAITIEQVISHTDSETGVYTEGLLTLDLPADD